MYLAGQTPLNNNIVKDGKHRKDYFIFPKQNLKKGQRNGRLEYFYRNEKVPRGTFDDSALGFLQISDPNASKYEQDYN